MHSFPGIRRLAAANALAVFSFVVFAAAVLSLHQERSISFDLEEAGPFPAVLSHYLFGSRDELADSAMTRFFRERLHTLPAEGAIERALQGEIKPSHELAPVDDGTGIGPILMIHTAFALLGLRARSLPYLFVLVIGLSAVAFMLRFQDRRIFAVPVLLTAFTALVLSPLTLTQVAQQAPFGGMRSYAIVGILAALHWCFDIVTGSSIRRPRWIVGAVLLTIQIAVLGFAILVRNAPAYLFGPPFAVGLYSLRANWGWPGLRNIVLRVVVPAVALVAVLFSITPIAYPEYAREGRAFSTLWHRLFVTFGVHPAWPFPGLSEKYPCPEIPEGLTRGGSDRAGHCIWWNYARLHGVPVEQAVRETYGAEYEKALRSAVWYVVRTYPKETLETFLVVKPKMIIRNALAMLALRATDENRLFVALFVLQCAILIASMIVWPLGPVLADIASAAGLLLLFLACSVTPQIIAWASPPTAIDFNVFVMCTIILGFWSALAVARMAPVRFQAACRLGWP